MELLADLGEYLGEVASHYWALATGGLITGVVFGIERLTKGALSRGASWLGGGVMSLVAQMTGGLLPRPASLVVFASASLLISTFQAWRAERVLKPGPDLRYYDTVIRADQDWRLEVYDRNNAPTSCKVLIGRQRLVVVLENRRGISRTGIDRVVRVEPPMGSPTGARPAP